MYAQNGVKTVDMVELSSPNNPQVREFVRLGRSRRYRDKSGKIALEGPNLVRAALTAGLVPLAVFCGKRYLSEEGTWVLTLPPGTKRFIVSTSLLGAMAETESPRGVAAIFSFKAASPDPAPVDESSPLLLLDRIRDPGNMGSIIRTAAAAGVGEVWHTGGSVDPYNPKALRSTAGAVFSLQIGEADDAPALLTGWKTRGLQVVAACSTGPVLYWDADYRPPTVLIIGNEAGGIDPSLVELSDLTVSIPLAGQVESLNAAAAAAVILYEINRQRRADRA